MQVEEHDGAHYKLSAAAVDWLVTLALGAMQG